MLIWEVAKKYARALFLSAQEKGLLHTIYEQVGDLKVVAKKDRDLLDLLSTPQILPATKKEMIRQVFTGRVERLLVEFMIVLVDKRRADFLVEIIDEYRRMVEAAEGVGRVTVITAVPLKDDERTRLAKKLAVRTRLKIVLEEKIDRRIIGGMIVILYNEIIDGSVRYGLNKVREQLDRVRVHAGAAG